MPLLPFPRRGHASSHRQKKKLSMLRPQPLLGFHGKAGQGGGQRIEGLPVCES